MATVNSRANQKIKKGDLVRVLSGKERGKTGTVLKIVTQKNRVVVEGLNMVTLHQKPNAQNQQGGIVKKEAAIHLSNVSHVEKKVKTTKGKKTVKSVKKEKKEE
ncbi:MAG: 50S ribosomal protein L24 [Bdellovibrionales bacterium]|nr:50S ribosomal protein L24 [Bdellovibrionales bacterium]